MKKGEIVKEAAIQDAQNTNLPYKRELNDFQVRSVLVQSTDINEKYIKPAALRSGEADFSTTVQKLEQENSNLKTVSEFFLVFLACFGECTLLKILTSAS